MKSKLVLLVLFLLPLVAFAQKDTRETQSQISYQVSPNGPQGVETRQYNETKINEIVSKIREARLAGDVQKSEQLQRELESVTGNISERKISGQNDGGFTSEVLNQQLGENDYNLTIINSDPNWAVATSTDRVTGRIYVVSAKYSGSPTVSDTIKIYSSTNNGISWTLVARIQNSSPINWKIDELDIEAVNNGTTSYIFIVAGYVSGGNENVVLFRYNSGGGEFFANVLYTGTAGNRFFYPRITSDNGVYTTNSYVYVICTQDTALTPPNWRLLDKFCILTTPFVASPPITYRNNFTYNCYAWYYSPVPDTTTMYNDIAYSDSAGFDYIVTVSNFYRSAGFYNLYLSYSKDFGVTVPAKPQISETRVNYKPRIGSTQLDAGGAQYMMIGYTRQFSSSDWDPFYQRTTNNGLTWSGGYISSTTDSTMYTDVVSIPRVQNTFRCSYMVKTGANGTIWTRSFNNGTFLNAFTLASGMTPLFTPIRSGYRYSVDSCFNVAEYIGGNSALAYSGCSGSLVGIGNNESNISYKLSQNYPNPFNPVTKISYSIANSGFVSLKIYDITGRLVSTLVNEIKSAGNYIIDFNGENLPSGAYFCKLESGSFSDIIKLMLIK